MTFANAGTVGEKIGLVAVDTATGPPGRASNTTDVGNFDVDAAPVGGGGTITANAWKDVAPTTATKAVANADESIAFCLGRASRISGKITPAGCLDRGL